MAVDTVEVTEAPTKLEFRQTILDQIAPYEDNVDPNHRTHIVNPVMNDHLWKHFEMTSQEIVDLARMTNRHVITLCGHRFYPKGNPEKYDICKRCMEIAAELMRANGE